jgi:spore photoproduct lyase
MKKHFEFVFIPNNIKNNKTLIQAVKNITFNKKIYINDLKEIDEYIPPEKNNFLNGKKSLLFLENKGQTLKPCPGTHNLRCCNYTVINTGINCPFDCQYCFLQFYLNFYINILYVDVIEKLQLQKKSFNNLKNYIRIGTGEFTDSLAYDDIIPYSIKLIDFFSNYKKVVLELKTKSNNINNLFKINDIGNTVISYSLNPEKIISEIEKDTTTINQRFNALKEVSDYGYKIAFHLDPIIHYKNCLDDYKNMLEDFFQLNIDEKKIVWISMGTFRFNSTLKPVVKKRFPNTTIFTGEFVQCADEKWRYFQKIRIKLYNELINKIKEKYKNVFIYLCMESPTVWKNTLGWFPATDNMLAQSFFNS